MKKLVVRFFTVAAVVIGTMAISQAAEACNRCGRHSHFRSVGHGAVFVGRPIAVGPLGRPRGPGSFRFRRPIAFASLRAAAFPVRAAARGVGRVVLGRRVI